MKVIVGLGNPGEEYKGTRHNVGYKFVDRFRSAVYGDQDWETSKKFNAQLVHTQDMILVKPMTFMNSSGTCVSSLMNYHKLPLDSLYIIHDDLDMELGDYKIQFAVGPHGHNGIADIENKLGTKDFWRVRLGVDNRNTQKRIPGKGYVLQKFNEDEAAAIKEVINEAIQEF